MSSYSIGNPRRITGSHKIFNKKNGCFSGLLDGNFGCVLGIFGAVMASLPAVDTKMVVFDTAVVDLSEDLKDPVDLLFGVQLGRGTDINKALQYCQQITSRPSETTLVLVTDLYEGGIVEEMKKRMASIVGSGVQSRY